MKEIGRPKKNDEDKVKGNERIQCDICDKSYTRYNSSKHKKTKYHEIYKKALEIFKQIMHEYERSKALDDIVKERYVDTNGNIEYLTKKQYNFYSMMPNNVPKYKKL
jgi:hypothetical protein